MIRALLRAFAIVACVELLLIGAWAVGARSGYEAGAFDAGKSAYTDGWNAALKGCTRWGRFPSGLVVICERKK